MDGSDGKDVMKQMVEWLRQNNLGNTEQILLREFENHARDVVTQAKSSKDTANSTTNSTPERTSKNVKPAKSSSTSTSTSAKKEEIENSAEKDEGKKPHVEETPSQPQQDVNDLVATPTYVSGLSSTQLGPCTEDEWLAPDDLGFLRIPAKPADLSDIVEDEEHRRCLPPYVEELRPVDLKKDPPKPASAAASGEEEDGEDEDGDIAPPPGDPEPIEDSQAAGGSSEEGPVPQSLQEAQKASKSAADVQPPIAVPPLVKKPEGNRQYTQYDTEHGRRSKTQPTVYEAFDLKVIYEVNRTGFEEHKDYPIRMHAIIAGRYQILEYLGSAAFSRAVQCVDLKNGQLVCVKIIRNNKDFFDQGLDEIKLLQYINSAGDANECCVLQLYDYFYHKEHLFLVCELLRDNLYEFSKYNRESGDEPYFTLPRLQRITRQVLTALRFVHRLNLIHCDLKPENILIKSYSRCEVKVIDFGSTCFTTDHLSTYVQSRCYRAPEVILGLPYTQKIDMWSLGAILGELYSGRVLFHNDSVQTMMARILGLCGPVPSHMLRSGRYTNRFFSRQGRLFERSKATGSVNFLQPRRCTLRHRLGAQAEPLFVDFLEALLAVDPASRPTAAEALQHPWLQQEPGPLS